jgi:hypothetical protein
MPLFTSLASWRFFAAADCYSFQALVTRTYPIKAKSCLLSVFPENDSLASLPFENLCAILSPSGKGSIIGKVKSAKILYHNNEVKSNFDPEMWVSFTPDKCNFRPISRYMTGRGKSSLPQICIATKN